jgi:hypothetical protein
MAQIALSFSLEPTSSRLISKHVYRLKQHIVTWWKWIGHTIRKDENAVERIVLDWNPQGTRKRGRPIKTWKSVMEEAQREGMTWREAKRLAADRSR